MTTKAASSKKKAASKNLLAEASQKAKVKKKAAPKKKKATGSRTGKVKTKNTRHKRNKNNITDAEQNFANAIMTDRDGLNATDIMLQINTKIKRNTARTRAHEWLKDPRITAYMNMMRDRVEEKVEYDLVKWREDVLYIIDIGMGRKEMEQIITIKDEKTGKKIDIQIDPVKQFDGQVATRALELIAKQMKLLTDKVELGGHKGQPLVWDVNVVKSDHADSKKD